MAVYTILSSSVCDVEQVMIGELLRDRRPVQAYQESIKYYLLSKDLFKIQ